MVSFVIPSYNSYLTIAKTIESIYCQSRKDLIVDVIVVDSSDDSKTREFLRSFQRPNFKLLAQEKKTSPSLGRNIGARSARGNLLCFIDSDVYLDGAWLQHVIESFRKGCLAGCGSISLPPFQVDHDLATAQLYLQFNEYLDTVKYHDRLFVPSCNLFCERGIFEKVGGFPDMRASEDTMFCLSLKDLTKIWFVPTARCFHVFREEWGSFKKNQEMLGRYVIIYRRKYYRKWFYKGIFAVILFPIFLFIKMVWICKRVKNAGSTHIKPFLRFLGVFLIGLMFWSWGFLKGCLRDDENIGH